MSVLNCVSHGRMGNALDAFISCLVFANFTNRTMRHIFAQPSVRGGGSLTSQFRMNDRLPRSRKMCHPPHVQTCVGFQNDPLGPMLRPSVTWIESCTAFRPSNMKFDEFIRAYLVQARTLHSGTSGFEACVAVHLRTGLRHGSDVVDLHSNEPRFNINASSMEAAIARVQNQNDRVICSKDDSQSSFNISRCTEYLDTTDMKAHTLMGRCHTIISYAFSSFSWTSAAIYGARYIVAMDIPKAKWYGVHSTSAKISM